ncbi:MAG TPA: hypothetical protein VGK69_07015 [Gaiellaceae bacterium]
MLRGALRRIAVIVAVLVGGTAAISVALGALAGKNLSHALAVGFYLVGAGVLFGSLALGSRGPMRADRNFEDDNTTIVPTPIGPPRLFSRRSLRKATPEERSDARRASLGLFVLGLLLILLGTAFDPSRHAF